MKYTLRDYQKRASDAAVRAFQRGTSNGLLVLPTGCHTKGTKVLMYDGTMKCVEDVRIGDKLMGVDSTPRLVLELHSGIDEMYEITPKIGNPFVVNKGHILSLYKTKEGEHPSQLPRVDEISVSDYLNTSNTYKHIHKLHKPQQIDFGHAEGYVGEPYLLGLFLGDGSSSNGSFSITTMREEVVEYLSIFCEKCGYKIRISEKANNQNKAKSYYITDNGKKNKPNQVLEWLRSLGLFGLTSGEKFIPHSYKTASIKDRYELLAGLLDTDAWYDDKKCSYEYCTKSLVMAKDIQFLCRSLGFMCNIGKNKVVNDVVYYRLFISGDIDKIPTKVAIRQARARKMKKSVLVTGFSIEYAGTSQYFGFTLDGDHLYMDEQFFIHHNSGKSLTIADIASRLDSPLLVFQPSVEILKQNYEKICSYDMIDVGIYSASVNQKNIRRITLATIGSAYKHIDDFRVFKYVLIDEAHLVSSKGGMYKEFIENRGDRVVVGLTASPYRLESTIGGSMLKFLTRTRPRIFSKVLYVCQTGDLLRQGYISPVRYFDVSDQLSFDIRRVKVNSTGRDYDEESLQLEYERSGFMYDLENWTIRVLHPKDGRQRNGTLVFTRFVRESRFLVNRLRAKGISAEIVTGETPKKERERIVEDFKAKKIQVLANAGCFVCGFDYPALDTVIIAHPTRSLARYYQEVGRCVRLYEGKEAWVLDMCGNYKRFGSFEDLRIECPLGSSRWVVTSRGRQLTGVVIS